MRVSVCVRSFAVLILLFAARPAAAQATRTWVSGVGDDLNPCSRTAPCKTFAGAISKTIEGGEIDAIDPGGFGTVSINKSITIDGGGTFSSILASGVTGVIVNAGAGDVVTLRNLSINGTAHDPNIGAPGITGVRVTGGRSVLIENCAIFGFQKGIDFQPVGGMSLSVVHSSIHDNTNSGVFVKANGAFFARLSMSHTTLTENAVGMFVQDNSLVYANDVQVKNSLGNGFHAKSTFGGAAQLTIENSSSSNNGNAGIVSENSGAAIRILNTTIDHNVGAGVVPLAGGQMLSAGNNHSIANASGDGSVTGTISVM